MPPGYEPLLAAVCAAPWDDLPRLAFADWLDDHGDADRAEFIRLHCRMPGPVGQARDRADELVRRCGPAWRAAELPTPDGVHWGKYRRGFVTSVTFHSAPVFERHQAAVFAAAPIQGLTVRPAEPALAGSGLPARLENLSELALLGQTGDELAIALVTSPAASRLEWLTVQGAADPTGSGHVLTDRFGRAVAETPYLARLRYLSVSFAQLSPATRAAIEARYAPDRVHLSLWALA